MLPGRLHFLSTNSLVRDLFRTWKKAPNPPDLILDSGIDRTTFLISQPSYYSMTMTAFFHCTSRDGGVPRPAEQAYYCTIDLCTKTDNLILH